ncbi:MAG: hypothetical protein ISS84_00345 [Candidatus Pacebacteria bacterium]|nr:hypothetical protein [Candidatus Paceibacterota bacterium]
MIATPHLLIGAAIVSKIKFLPLAFSLAFLSHYFLDFIPHVDYSAKNIYENIYEKKWKKFFPDFLKIILDISLTFFLILIFSKNQPIIFVGAFLAILGDGLNFLNFVFPNNRILEIHYNLHQRIHFYENKKISFFWRIFSQIVIVLIAIFFLR